MIGFAFDQLNCIWKVLDNSIDDYKFGKVSYFSIKIAHNVIFLAINKCFI